MSKSFENALSVHLSKQMNYLEFRRVWSPVWITLCRSGEAYFPMEANTLVAAHAVVAILVTQQELGRQILGLTEYNRFMALVNDATAKFNAKAACNDPLSHKVLLALTEAVNNGYIS